MNWSELVAQLKSAGLSRREIARQADCSLSLINAISAGHRGKNLNWRVADALRAMQADMSKAHTFVEF